MKIKAIVTISLILVYLLGTNCTATRDFDNPVDSIVKPHRFSIVNWESKTLFNEIRELIADKSEKTEDDLALVTEYYSLVERIKTLKSQINAINTANEQGDLALLKAELSELEEQKSALKDMVDG